MGKRIVANILNFDITVTEFYIHLCYNVPFQTNTIGDDLNSVNYPLIDKIIPALSF